MVQKHTTGSETIRWKAVFWLIILAFCVAAVSALVGASLHIIPDMFKSCPEIALTILLSSGLISLIAILTITVSVLTALGLSDPERAFGMPDGTIRAVIALSLILIFSIMSIYLYQSIRNPVTREITVTKEQLGQIPAREILSSTPMEGEADLYRVQRLYSNESSKDFARQLLTTISTLVVAVAGFYFGTRAVSSANAQERQLQQQPVIQALKPNKGKPGGTFPHAEILGRDFSSPKIVKLVQPDANIEINFAEILSSQNRIQAKLTLPTSAGKGAYQLVIVNDDGQAGYLDNAFTVE